MDENMGTKTVAAALRAAGAAVEVYVDHFPRGIPDETWLAEVGRRGWLVLTKDLQIRYRSVETPALLRSGVGAFALTAKNLSGAENADILVKALPRMERCAAGHLGRSSRPCHARAGLRLSCEARAGAQRKPVSAAIAS
jgi:hypothetical protein